LLLIFFTILAKKQADMTKDHEKMIERIYSEIVGDEYTDGLIPRVDRLEKKVDNQDIKFKVGAGLIAAISTIVLFFEQIKELLK
jgi:hypothetical protein